MKGKLLESAKDSVRNVLPNKFIQFAASPIRNLTLDILYKRAMFQFIHINKCGGTSVERAIGLPFLNHDLADERKKRVGKEHWNSCFKFTVCRNPFDRMESVFYYQNRKKNVRNVVQIYEFEKMLENIIRNQPNQGKARMYWSQVAWVSSSASGEIIIDAAFHLENIDKEWGFLQERLPKAQAIERLKVRNNKAEKGSLYSNNTIDMVKKHCARDFQVFGYSLEFSERSFVNSQCVEFVQQ